MQIMKLTQKWVFDGQTRPTKIWILKDQIGLICGGSKIVKREGEEKRKRKKKNRRRGAKIKPTRYGTLDFCMETELKYGFMEF